MPTRDAQDVRPTRRRSGRAAWGGWLLVIVLALAAGGWWWRQGQSPRVPVPAPAAMAPPAPAAPTAAAPGELPGFAPPLAEPPPSLPALVDSDAFAWQRLADLLGAARVGQWLVGEGLVRRMVATVDNLGREQAPASRWPIHPTAGRFTVQEEGGRLTIAPANAARYQGFVAFAESAPLDGTLALYVQLYPLLQAAYEELGFPGQSFQRRLVAVIDLLLATPEVAGPLALHLTPVAGEVASLRPWVRYELADAHLQQLASGQKMLLRMGPDNAARLKALLRALRARLMAQGPQVGRPGGG